MMNEVNATPHAELIAELMNPTNPKNEREHAAVREIERLRESLENPVLEDIEQYRLQIAGICTAAIGYWKDGDKIDPDYNTLALRDVAKLYSKYDALYKAQPVNHAVIAGALFDFMAWLTTRDERLVLSGADEAGPAVEAITAFSKMRGLSLDDAQVQNWQEALAHPEHIGFMDSKLNPIQRTWVGLTDEEIDHFCHLAYTGDEELVLTIQARLKEKNT